MTRTVSCDAIYERLGLADAPMVVDARSSQDLDLLPRMIPGAWHVDPDEVEQWSTQLPFYRQLALYDAAGKRPASAANALGARGVDVVCVEGGLDEWIRRKLPTIKLRVEFGVPGRSQWITRERPKIDRLACPWLLRRFIDPTASFFYVPAQSVRAEAGVLHAEPYDIADVTFSHRGEKCSFDAFLDEFDLHDPILDQLADIVRSADTGTLDRSREAPGLLAISLGLSATIKDDLLLLEQGMAIYDALYAWCKTARDETHSWPQRRAAQ